MLKQPRVLIGDIGDLVATLSADCLRRKNRWVVTRTQQYDEMQTGFRKEHPDIIILNGSVYTMDIASYMRQILAVCDVQFIVVFTLENSYLAGIYQDLGAYCIMVPDSLEGLQEMLEDYCGKAEELTIETVSDYELEVELTLMLLAMNIPESVQGFHFLRRAVLIYFRTEDALNMQSRELYEKIAEYYNSAPSRVEHAIRHALSHLYSAASSRPRSGYLPIPMVLTEKPSNTECIALLSDWLRLRFALRGKQITTEDTTES